MPQSRIDIRIPTELKQHVISYYKDQRETLSEAIRRILEKETKFKRKAI